MKHLASSFLGTGWSFPPTFSRETWGVDLSRDDQDIQESLRILFSTAPGERTLLPEYGTRLWPLLFQTVNAGFQTLVRDSVATAILHWEPRIEVLEIRVEPVATTDGLVLVHVDYAIRQTNVRSNLVFPFYLHEGTLAPPAP